MERLIPYIPSSLLPHLPLIYRTSTSFSHWIRHSWSARLLLLLAISRMTYRWWPKKDIKEKWFLVTGAGGGIGRFICLALAKQGAHLVLCDINTESLQSLAKHIHESYPQCHIEIFTCDISKKENIYEMAKKVQQRCNFIYGVINNAGIVSALPFLSIPDSRIEQTLNVNTMSSVWMTKAFLPEMVKRNEGHITFVTSAAGLTGCPKMVDYCMSKFALVGFADALRAELKLQKSAVCTTIICPAYVQTPLFNGWKSGPLESPLTPEYVGYKIVDSIQRDKLMVCMPRMVYVAVALQAILPTAVQDQLKLICGLGHSMDEYRGRSGS